MLPKTEAATMPPAPCVVCQRPSDGHAYLLADGTGATFRACSARHAAAHVRATIAQHATRPGSARPAGKRKRRETHAECDIPRAGARAGEPG